MLVPWRVVHLPLYVFGDVFSPIFSGIFCSPYHFCSGFLIVFPHSLNNSHQFLSQKHISLEKVLVLSVKARKSQINQDRLALDVKIPTIILTGIPGML